MLRKYESLINNKPIHIATISADGKPNLAVVADVKVIDDNRLLISHNEMINTPKNIQNNNNIVITAFDDNWAGIRLTGTAEYYSQGKYIDMAIKFFKNKSTNPIGAIIVTVNELEELK